MKIEEDRILRQIMKTEDKDKEKRHGQRTNVKELNKIKGL